MATTIEPGTGRAIPVTSREITVVQFIKRTGFAETIALEMLLLDPTTDLVLRGQLAALKSLRDNAKDKLVNLDDPLTAAGALILFGALAGLPEGTPGRVTPDQISTRVDALLADFPQAGEATT